MCRAPLRCFASLLLSLASISRAASGDFDAERARADLKVLAAVGPRLPGSVAKDRVAEFLVERLRQAGFRTRIEPLPRPGGSDLDQGRPLANVVGEKLGTSKTPRVLVLIAHYDGSARIGAGPEDTNCGLSGVAAVLEAARVLGARDWPASIVVALTDGHFRSELTGERSDDDAGARVLVAELERAGRLGELVAVIAVDRLGFQKFEVANEVGLSREFRADLTTYLLAAGIPQALNANSVARIPNVHDAFRDRGVRAVLPVIGRSGQDDLVAEATCYPSKDLVRENDLSTFARFGDLVVRMSRSLLVP